MSSDIVGHLRQIPVFSGLSEAHLAEIARVAGRRTFAAGEPIVRRGSQAHAAFFLILSGRVEVRRDERVLSELGTGQYFGEMSLFDNQPRSVDVVPMADTECVVIARWNLERLIKENPDIAMQMLADLSRRLRDTEERLDS